jgi:hypothetical protein
LIKKFDLPGFLAYLFDKQSLIFFDQEHDFSITTIVRIAKLLVRDSFKRTGKQVITTVVDDQDHVLRGLLEALFFVLCCCLFRGLRFYWLRLDNLLLRGLLSFGLLLSWLLYLNLPFLFCRSSSAPLTGALLLQFLITFLQRHFSPQIHSLVGIAGVPLIVLSTDKATPKE